MCKIDKLHQRIDYVFEETVDCGAFSVVLRQRFNRVWRYRHLFGTHLKKTIVEVLLALDASRYHHDIIVFNGKNFLGYYSRNPYALRIQKM